MLIERGYFNHRLLVPSAAYQNLRVEPKVGKTLIWPAQWTHTHRGNPPLSGFKMYATGWFSLVHPNF